MSPILAMRFRFSSRKKDTRCASQAPWPSSVWPIDSRPQTSWCWWRGGVVLFTAKDARQDRIEGDQQGADHDLTNPVRLEKLRAVVQALVWRLQVYAAWLYSPNTQVLKTPNKNRIQRTTGEGFPARGF